MLNADDFDKILSMDLGAEIEGSSANAPLRRMIADFKKKCKLPERQEPCFPPDV